MDDFHNILQLTDDLKLEDPHKRLKTSQDLVRIFQYTDTFKILKILLRENNNLTESIKPLLQSYSLLIKTLIRFLDDPDDEVVFKVIYTLGKVGDKQVDLPPLLRTH